MNPFDDTEFREAFKDLIKKKIDDINARAKVFREAREATKLTLEQVSKASLN